MMRYVGHLDPVNVQTSVQIKNNVQQKQGGSGDSGQNNIHLAPPSFLGGSSRSYIYFFEISEQRSIIFQIAYKN